MGVTKWDWTLHESGRWGATTEIHSAKLRAEDIGDVI